MAQNNKENHEKRLFTDGKEESQKKDATSFTYLALVMNILKDNTDLEIFTLLLMYQEQSLTQLTNSINKSKPTLSRHMQKLVSCGLVDVREEKVRGVKAKYFSLNLAKLQSLPNISHEDLKSASHNEEYYNILKNFLDTLKSTAFLGQKMLGNFVSGLDQLDWTPKVLSQFFGSKMLSLSFNVLSEAQFQRYLTITQEFTIKLKSALIEEEIKDPHAINPYFIFHAALPNNMYLMKKLQSNNIQQDTPSKEERDSKK